MHAEKTDPPQSVIPYVGDESHFSRLAAVVPCMLYDYVLKPDSSSQFLYIGPKCREILELSEHDLLADAGMFWELVLAEDMERLKYEDMLANRKGTSFSAEVRIRTRSGCLKWLQLSSKPNPAQLGEIVVWSGFMLDITDRKQIEEALKSSEERLRQITDVAPILLAEVDQELCYRFVNIRYAELFGLPPEAFHGQHVRNIIGGQAFAQARPYMLQALAGQPVEFKAELPEETPWGRKVMAARYAPVRDGSGQVTGFVAAIIDISERKQVEDALRESEEKFKALADSLPLAIYMSVGIEEKAEYANSAFVRMFGYTLDDVPEAAQWWPLAYPGETYRRKIVEEWQRKVERAIETRSEIEPMEVVVTCKDGSHKNILWGYKTLGTQNYSYGLDLTERKQAEEEIKQLAFYDPLTQLPNRRLLLDRLQQALATSVRSRRYGALLFIDLDNFKTLNDTLGHDQGDLLLQEVASRISACVRECDTVARLGGDEFVVMLTGMDGDPEAATAQAQKIGRKILAMLNQVYSLVGHEHYCSASIGITLFCGQNCPTDELLKQADIALYQAKNAGRNTLCFFDSQMQLSINAQVVLLNDLRHALAKNQFKLFCQAEVGHDQKMIGVEVLLRWDHPKQGLISPHEFISLAEETGLIQPIGQWVLESACALLKSWERGIERLDLYLAVNISVRQFHQPNFVNEVLDIVRDTGIDPSQLMLELTETVVLAGLGDSVAKMNTLKEVGIRFSLDDFGTGYSSLAYLARLPFDQLKIDRSFVQHLAPDSNDLALCEAIVVMAHKLGIKVIAEGIETQDQYDILKQIGCDYGQGSLLSGDF